MPVDWPVHSPFARRHFSEGLRRGFENGLAVGRVDGYVEEARTVLFVVMRVRGMKADEQMRDRIKSCKDFVKLEEWVARAVTVARPEEIFEDQP